MPDDIADHRRTSYELWQQLAARWERQRRTLWEPSRRVSEWLVDRLQGAWPNLIVVHTPIHASWLNQAEIYFSVVQRKVVTPNDFADLDTLAHQLLAFGRRYEEIAAPFQWKFTRHDLHKLLAKTDTAQPTTLAA